MLLDREGNRLDSFVTLYGIIVPDGEFKFALPYEDEHSVECKTRIRELKGLLEATDYKALKYAEGALSDAEYEETKKSRKSWRDEINKLETEIKTPTITREEMDKAEEKARKELEGSDVTYQDVPLSL